MSQIRKKVGSIMVLEIAPSNRLQLFSAGVDRLKRILAVAVGVSICVMGISVLMLPGFEAEAMTVIKSMIGVSLLVCGVSMTRVGTVRKPIELAFDRTTEEWKLSARKGRKMQMENAAPRGSVLTLTGNAASMHDARAVPLFDLHLDKPARTALVSEYQRLQSAH